LQEDFAIRPMVALALFGAVVFSLLGSLQSGAALMAGAGLGLFNYHWLFQGAVRFFEVAQAGGAKGGTWVILAILRLGFLAAAMILLVKMGFDPLGLVVGLSVPMVAQVGWSMRRALNRSAQARS
jgi:hypothetical protein